MRVVDYINERYKIVQDTDLYRFTSDSLLLSRFVKAQKDEAVADFCAGSGIVGLNFYAENTGVRSVCFFEAQQELSSLCEESIALNDLSSVMRAERMRVQDIPNEYSEKFSLILANPPFENGGFESAKKSEAACKKELTLTLRELCESARRCLKFGGRFVLCHRADRAAEVLYTLHETGLEPKKIQFVAGRAGKEPYLILVAAKKGAKPGVIVLNETAQSGEVEG